MSLWSETDTLTAINTVSLGYSRVSESRGLLEMEYTVYLMLLHCFEVKASDFSLKMFQCADDSYVIQLSLYIFSSIFTTLYKNIIRQGHLTCWFNFKLYSISCWFCTFMLWNMPEKDWDCVFNHGSDMRGSYSMLNWVLLDSKGQGWGTWTWAT